MKEEFNLGKAMSGHYNVITRKGENVTDLELRDKEDYALSGMLNGVKQVFTRKGKFYSSGTESEEDLFLVPIKQKEMFNLDLALIQGKAMTKKGELVTNLRIRDARAMYPLIGKTVEGSDADWLLNGRHCMDGCGCDRDLVNVDESEVPKPMPEYSKGGLFISDKDAEWLKYQTMFEKEIKDKIDILKNDPVNNPAHYTDGKIEVIDFIEDKKLGFHLGNAIKYISRAGKKDPLMEKQDLEKAIWYINRKLKSL